MSRPESFNRQVWELIRCNRYFLATAGNRFWEVLPRKRWPVIKFKPKRAITREEHRKILLGEKNPEWRAYYELLWYLRGSQTEIASLSAQDIDWTNHTIAYARKKTRSRAIIHLDEAVEKLLESLPIKGSLCPHLNTWKHSDRAKAFIRRCKLVGVSGVSLHSYRYAWAERAKQAGYPERFAQQALGHNSKAVHPAYARHAQVVLPSLATYEKQANEQKIVPFPNPQPGRPLPNPQTLVEGRGVTSSEPVGSPLTSTQNTRLPQ